MAVNVSAYFIAFTTWRLILKRATGVLMGLQPGSAYAQGILLTNLNQVVNLINAAYAKRVLRRGHVLFHSSAVTWNGWAAVRAEARERASPARRCISSKTAFGSSPPIGCLLWRDPTRSRFWAIPSSPGSIRHAGSPSHARALLTAEDRNNVAMLSPEELRLLERKRDVDLDAIYGSGTVALSRNMKCLVLLK